MNTIENESAAMEIPAPETHSFGDAIADVQVALRHMGGEFADELPELLEAAKTGEFGVALITPEIVGQFLMENLPDNRERLTPEQKLFWMKVADWMGPDYLAGLRRVAAFMDKIDQF